MRPSWVRCLGVLSASLLTSCLPNDPDQLLNEPMDLAGVTLCYTVPPGATIGNIAQDLFQADILDRPEDLVRYARQAGKAAKVKAGEYEIKPGTTPMGLLEMLVDGRVIQYTFTLVEGWTFRELQAAIAEHPKIVHTLSGLERGAVMQRLGRAGTDPEGQFFPDTYYFMAYTADLEILRRAHRRMASKLNESWSKREAGLPYKTPYEALTMASIIEKETALVAELPQIAGVFVRRLRRGMPLQTDPTIIYGLGTRFDGDLRRQDLQLENPYNTYRNKGLTPTPIAMPGEVALQAALHPAEGETLYFVARGDGSHKFSTSLEEHNRAVAEYQLKASTPSP